ncbi:hypothetical protein LSTR_LSTR008164 [Laodelphax striatellus]|uniref:Protein kinase domain-containing protein n=1 Tax=Laodelphax striatellus TaxID=195883 RepID=A0A482WZ40_LAOST|nr:hypothetical protein LSTR_LSTR008164 [Laodelphax striatellus]
MAGHLSPTPPKTPAPGASTSKQARATTSKKPLTLHHTTIPPPHLAYVDELPTSSIDKYMVIDGIAKGGYGNVYEVRVKNKILRRWALKKKNREPLLKITNPERREIHALRNIKNEVNVIELADIVGEPGMLSPVFELCSMDLFHLVFNNPFEISRENKLSIVKQLLNGLKAVHFRGFIHRDVKPSNVLINRHGIVKLADFGGSIDTQHERQTHSKVVTNGYRAPELLLGDINYTNRIDIWSAGVVVAEMWLRHYWIRGVSEHQQLAEIFGFCGFPTDKEWPDMRFLPEFPTVKRKFPHFQCSDAARRFGEIFGVGEDKAVDFMLHVMQLDPKKRISADEALAHPFLEGVKDDVKSILDNPDLDTFC